MSNLAVVQKAYQDFGAGNIPAVLAVLDENVKWMGSSGFPFHDGDGIVVGPQSVLEKIFTRIPEFFTEFGIDVQRLYESGDTVIVESFFKGVWKASGKPFQANGITLWDMKDGKVTRTFEAIDTGAMMN